MCKYQYILFWPRVTLFLCALLGDPALPPVVIRPQRHRHVRLALLPPPPPPPSGLPAHKEEPFEFSLERAHHPLSGVAADRAEEEEEEEGEGVPRVATLWLIDAAARSLLGLFLLTLAFLHISIASFLLSVWSRLMSLTVPGPQRGR